MIQDIESTIRAYLPDIIHMSLATSRDNKPWVCEVHFVYDDPLNLYFRSVASSRHSEEIRLNPNVAGNIVTQHHPGDKPRGVYFEGKAEELENVDEANPAFTLYCERFGTDKSILEDGKKFYKITVENFYVFDARESKPSQKYSLAWGTRKQS